MVMEQRELTFTNKELVESINIFPKKASLKLPDGKITNISIEDDSYVFAVVQIRKAEDDKIEKVALDSSSLAAILLFYCRSKKIPIPKNAKKNITKVESGVSLNISII